MISRNISRSSTSQTLTSLAPEMTSVKTLRTPLFVAATRVPAQKYKPNARKNSRNLVALSRNSSFGGQTTYCLSTVSQFLLQFCKFLLQLLCSTGQVRAGSILWPFRLSTCLVPPFHFLTRDQGAATRHRIPTIKGNQYPQEAVQPS